MTFVPSRKPIRKATIVPAVARPIPAPQPVEPKRTQAQQALDQHTLRPVGPQGQVVQPPLRAAALERQEVQRLQTERQVLQAQLAAVPLAPEMVEAALDRQTRGTRSVPLTRPVTPQDWVTVLQMQAEEVTGRPLNSRQVAQFTALQRQVAQTLAQGFRADRGPAAARYGTYGAHLADLQRHPTSAPVAQVVLGLVPAAERLSLQRAMDDSSREAQAQEVQDGQALHRLALQRQLAELDAEATQPVLQRIKARRGGGNPLPEAVRRHLEQGLNHDLSRVRIHDDAEADKLAKGVQATAFTTGTDIFFRSGQFRPNTRSGLELLAHEVTHAVQQSQGRVGKGIDPDAGLESEARTVGRTLVGRTFAFGPLKAGNLPKLAPFATKVTLQRLQAKPQMTWTELQTILRAKLLDRLGRNVTQLKSEAGKYRETGATPQWKNLLKLVETDRQVRAEQQHLVKGIQQKYPQGLAGLPFPVKLKGQAAAPDPAYWLSYIQTVTKQLGASSGPYVEAMRQLAASEGLRAAAHKSFPAMSALATTATPLEAEQSPRLLGEMKTQFADTTDAIGKLRGEIQAGKIPWKYTDLVVQDERVWRQAGCSSSPGVPAGSEE